MAMRDLRGTAAFNVTVQLSWDDWEYLQMILKGHVLKLDRYCDDELSAMAKAPDRVEAAGAAETPTTKPQKQPRGH